jgi:hypothetical protein
MSDNSNKFINIPHLEFDKKENKSIDRDKINKYVIQAFNNCINDDLKNDTLCIRIFSNHGLTIKELSIAKGIILANGFEYWEV